MLKSIIDIKGKTCFRIFNGEFLLSSFKNQYVCVRHLFKKCFFSYKLQYESRESILIDHFSRTMCILFI
jgi:hypothetical protein